MRTRRIIAALAIVGALAAGCGSGPDRVDSAAIVGQDSIPLAQAQDSITSVLRRPGLVETLRSRGGSEADIGRAVVSQLVIRDLLARAAREQNLTVPEAEVDQEIARAGGEESLTAGSLAVGGARAATRDDLMLGVLAGQELSRLSVTADIAVTQTGDKAQALAREIAAGGERSERALAGAGTTQRRVVIRPAETPQAALTPLIGIPAGWVAAFQLGNEQQGWVVVRVTERKLDGPPPPPGASATAGLDPQSVSEAGIRLLTPDALRTGVELSPRYGEWDPIQMLAVPPGHASLVMPVAQGAPTPPPAP